MDERSQITDLKSYLLEVVVKPWRVSLIFGTVVTAFGVFCLIRDQFMPKEWQDRLSTPHLSLRTWLCVILASALVSVILKGFKAWEEQHLKLKTAMARKPLPDTAPEFRVEACSPKSMGYFDQVMLTNISTSNIHDIDFTIEYVAPDVSVVWKPSEIAVLVSKGSHALNPMSLEDMGDGTCLQQDGIIALLNLMAERKPNHALLPLGFIRFTCRDRVNHLYKCSVELTFIPSSRRLKIAPMKRELIN